MKLSRTDQKVLWRSAAHWLENYEHPATAKFGRQSCPCCQAAMDRAGNSTCEGCPIFRYTGQTDCDGTPYGNAINTYYRKGGLFTAFQAAAAEEYTFLVSLALGENP